MEITYRSCARRGYRLLCDGAHLSEAGAALVAEAMLPAIRRILPAAEGPSIDAGVRAA